MGSAANGGAAGFGHRSRRGRSRGKTAGGEPQGSIGASTVDGRRAGRISRRRWLGVSAAVIAGAGGAVLVASSRRLGGVGPAPSAAPVVLTLQPGGLIPFNRTTIALYQHILRPFLQSNRRVRVQLTPTLWHANVQAILGGMGADVISDNYPPSYMASGGNLLLPLDGYIRRDGLDTAAWPATLLASYRAAAPDHGLYMLPGYFCPRIYALRLSDFDAAGVPRPDPGWSYREFAAAAKAMTRENGGKKRFGAVVDWYSDHIGGATWPFYAFGDGMLDGRGDSQLSNGANIRAGEYLYEQLFWPGVATTRDFLGPTYTSAAFVRDQTSMQLSWNGLVLDNAQRWRGFAWDYYPPPVFPQGPTCAAATNFYAIPATCSHPEAAWALLRFLTGDATSEGWQHGLVHLALQEPSLLALWDKWLAAVQAAAPPLGQKQLRYFKDLSVSGRAFPQQYYPRLDEQCQNLAARSVRALWARNTDVPTAFSRIDLLVNALLARAEAVETAQGKALAAAALVTPGATASYAPPPCDGLGASATPAGGYVLLAPAGTWTLLGDGTAVGGTSDNTMFACLPITASQGEWSCRLVAVANVSCPQLSPQAAFGLMIRGDLSDDAAMAVLQVTGAGGMQWRCRPVPAVAPGGVAGPVSVPWPGGGATLMAPADRPALNYLLAPVWLRLRRRGTTWTAMASRDGKIWSAVGRPEIIRAGGVWIGVHCCAHNADWGGSGYVRGVFDHLTFVPSARMQVGDQGVPPVAGAVAVDWASATPALVPASAAGGVPLRG